MGYYIKEITAADIDELVLKGIQHIKNSGERINVTAGTGLQAYGVTYVLTDTMRRVHNLRYPSSLRYLCRELIAFFKGSLNVQDGLAQSSPMWLRLADKRGKINSNYGYYVFHQKFGGRTQYEWVISNLKRNQQSRKALININRLTHKNYKSHDFPCTIGIQFLIRQNYLCCEVLSRSEDVILGLPYDMGFFSFVNELICADLNRTADVQLKLGYTMIRCSFTQIYDKNAAKAEELLKKSAQDMGPSIQMPRIDDVEKVLEDIYNGTMKSDVVQWIHKHADF